MVYKKLEAFSALAVPCGSGQLMRLSKAASCGGQVEILSALKPGTPVNQTTPIGQVKTAQHTFMTQSDGTIFDVVSS